MRVRWLVFLILLSVLFAANASDSHLNFRSGGTRVSPRRGLLCALWIEICEDLSPLRRSHFETARGFAAIWNSIL
jgi:hypothetical protein